jgi:NADPH-dependent glutamate synthase beta subunit-like oxidoreductase/NAD-dependent dihydropyrimidine dehydrogenase PreA subunit
VLQTVEIKIDSKCYRVPAGVSVKEAARLAGVYIPGLCSHPDLDQSKAFGWSEQVWQGPNPFAVSSLQSGVSSPDSGDSTINHQPSSIKSFSCNLCLIALGNGAEVHACETVVGEGLEIRTTGSDLTEARQKGLKGILAHHPHACLTCAQRDGCDRIQCSMGVPVEERCCELLGRCEIGKVSEFIGIPGDTPSYKPEGRARLFDEPLFVRDFELCIGCTRCVRVCRDVRGVDALGAVFDEGRVRVGTLKGSSLPESDCRYCGACVEVCPTGALRDKSGCAPLVEGKAPCTAACPLGIDIPGYLGLIGRGKDLEALELIREQAVLPGVLGYACFHPCEQECRRGSLDGAASICGLKRYVADTAGDQPVEFTTAAPTGKSVAVIGSGPAGLAAAGELLRAGHEVTIYERDAKLGGMLRQTLPAYRLPSGVIDRDLDYLLKLGLRHQTGVELGKDVTVDSLRDQHDAVILAIGLPKSVALQVAGSDLEGVIGGLEFLASTPETSARKVSGRVVVIGGGNVAIDSARVARRLGTLEVIVVCLESADEMPAFDDEVAEALEEGIEIRYRWGIEKIEGVHGKVEAVVLKRCLSVFDSQGKFRPEYDPSVTESLSTDSVIVAIGQKSDDGWKGFKPTQEGVFTAGDMATGATSIVQAMADGKKAARLAMVYLEKSTSSPSSDVSRDKNIPAGVAIGRIGRDEDFLKRPRVTPDRIPVQVRMASMEPYEATYTSEQARLEASRCLRCHLRARITPSPLPPDPWIKFSYDSLDAVPTTEGVLLLADSSRKITRINGSSNLRNALEDALRDRAEASYCRWELDPMFTKRESELLQAHLKEFGSMPGGGDLDDLF